MTGEPLRRTGVKRTTRRTINAATAAEAVGEITKSCEIYGLSKGQFSLVELIDHVLAATGPAHLVISTWTAAGADMAHTHGLLTDGRVLSMRWLVDFSFPSRQPGYCQILRDRFGDDAIRATANHAKFVSVTNAEWAITIRTSMNLNLNKRLESYELSDDPEMAAWLSEVVDAAFAPGGASSIGDATKHPSNARGALAGVAGNVATRAGIHHGAVKGISHE